jgi:hypothetical protein
VQTHRAPANFWQYVVAEPKGAEMSKPVVIALYVVAMAALIVGVDFAFFKNRFWERLMVNIGIVLVFGAFYFRFLNRP